MPSSLKAGSRLEREWEGSAQIGTPGVQEARDTDGGAGVSATPGNVDTTVRPEESGARAPRRSMLLEPAEEVGVEQDAALQRADRLILIQDRRARHERGIKRGIAGRRFGHGGAALVDDTQDVEPQQSPALGEVVGEVAAAPLRTR